MLNRGLILKKLDSLRGYLKELETFKDLSFEEYRGKISNRRSVERLIQLLVECASDINAHILAKKEKIAVEDYRSSFLLMNEKGLLNKDLSEGLSKAAGMRNILVHEYERIDDQIVFDTILLSLSAFNKYMKEILDLLK